MPCPLPLPYHSNHYSNDHHTSQTSNQGSSNSSLSSLSSQPSLPSIPSLTPHTVNSSVAHREVSVLKAHSSYVFSAALAGKHVFTGDSSGEIRVWDRNVPSSNHNNNNVVAQSYSAVKCIVALNDNKLITSHQDHKIRVWKKVDTIHYTLVTTLPTLGDRCVALFSSKSHVKVRRHKSSTWVHHVDTVSALALSSDGTMIYSISWDRSFKIWRTSDFKCVESECNAHDDAINAIVLSNDGFVYTGSADMKIKVWKKGNGEKRHLLVSTLEKHKSAVNALALSSDGCVLYSGACDRSIIVWEKDGGDAHMTVSGALRGHSKAILCLAVVEDLLCSGSADKTVRIWKRSESSYSCVAVLEGHNGPVKCLTAASVVAAANGSSDDGKSDDDDSYLVYSGSLDFDVRVWQIWNS